MVLLEEPRFTVAGHCSKKSYRGLFCCLEVSSIRAEVRVNAEIRYFYPHDSNVQW